MKKIYKYTLLLIAAFLFAPLAANADEVTGIKLEKDVSGPDENDQYTITLGTFVNGSSVTTVTESTRPVDIVLVLDVSGSMSQNVTQYSRGQRVGNNTQLDRSTTYIVVLDGQDYFLKCNRTGSTGNRRYSYYYSKDYSFTATEGTPWEGHQNLTAQLYGRDGEFYQVSSSTTTRIAAMKTAVKNFVRTVYLNSPKDDGVYHKISIVKFAGDQERADGYTLELTGYDPVYNCNGYFEVFPLADLTYGEQCDATVDALWAAGPTNADKGLAKAYSILQAVQGNGHPKVTVFFTDGSPTPNSGFNTGTARNAVNSAYQLKSLTETVTEDGVSKEIPSKVYSVALLSTLSDGQGNQIGRFLHYVSSNYKFQPSDSYNFSSNATPTPTNYDTNWTTPTGGSEAPHGYYQLSNGSDLTAIFEAIASESAETGGTSSSVTETSLVTVDVVSNYFKLPDGVSADNVGEIQVLFAPMTGIKDQSQWNNETYMKNLDNYLFGDPVTAAVAEENDPNPLILVSGEHQYPQVLVGKDADTGGDKITVTNYNFADNYCGPNKDQNGNFRHWRGYKLVIKIPIVVDVQNPGGASLETNAEGSGIYIAGSTEPLVPFPRPKVTLPNIIIRKFGLLYEGESASFRLEKLTDAGEVDTHVKPYNIVITATDSNPDTYDFVQVKLQHHGRYRVTETDWGWSYDCTLGSKVEYPYISGDNLTEEQEAANEANLAKMKETAGDEDADKMKEINVSGELSSTTFSPSNASQPYINRDVSGDTEQTVNLPGGSVLSGAVFDFHNTIKTETVDGQTKPLEKRNYSEAYKLNIFKFKGTVTTEESDETGNQ